MSQSFLDFCNEVYGTVDNKAVKIFPAIQAATVRYLEELSSKRMTLLEGTFQFTLVAGQMQYGSGTTGFPADVQEFDNVWVARTADTTGTRWELKGPQQIAEVSLRSSNVFKAVPDAYAFHDNRIWIAPPPPDGYVLGGEYLKNGTKDEATGNPITAASTTATNPWFGRGKHALMNKVLADIYATQLKDFQVAGAFDVLAEGALQRLRDEQIGRSATGYQVRANFGGLSW